MLKGVKRIIAVLGLVFLSSLVFVACKETEYETTSITFRETEKIVMVVGDEYTPSINVLPSYASNKGYHFEVMGNSTILRVESKKIVALKEGTAQLKVVADANEYLNDVISVKILREPIKLDTPTALRFDGQLISFAPVENATSYNLFVGDTKIEMRGRTSISLDDLDSYNIKLYDTTLTIKVQAVGDSKITTPSNISNEINVLKISAPQNLALKNNVLSFSKVAGVKEYLLDILQNDKIALSIQLNSANFAESECLIDLSKCIEQLNGGEYTCQLICSKNNYGSLANVEIFSSNQVEYMFDCLSQPQNFKMLNGVLYWNEVVNADFYTLWNEDSVEEEKIVGNQFDISAKIGNGHTYSYKLVARSNNETVVGNLKFSELITFTVLTNPEVRINIDNKLVEWEETTNAVAYKVVVKKDEETINSFLTTDTKLNVADFDLGSYQVEVTACGNGTTVLTANGNNSVAFVAQDVVKNVRIENKTILWDMDDEAQVNLVITDPTGAEVKNEILTTNSYDLSGFVLIGGEYKYTLQCLAKSNALASKIVENTFYKLQELADLKFEGNTFSFSIDMKTVGTKVECFKGSNPITITRKTLNEYTLDTESLSDGEYVIKAYAYGNNKGIFNADNIDKAIVITKLNTPTIEVDTVGRTINLASEVALATKYELYENGTKVAEFDLSNKTYSVDSVLAGQYEYAIKSIGNGKEIVDSNISNIQKRVARLTSPTMSFDKQTRKFALDSKEKDFVEEYIFTLDGENVAVVDMVADCSSSQYFQSAKTYTARAYLKSKINYGQYDLLLDSKETSVVVSKINPTANVTLDSGEINIAPTGFIPDENYVLDFKVGYKQGEEYIYVDCNQLTLKNGIYSFKVIDENYKFVGVQKDGVSVFELSNNFKLKWTVKNTDELTIDSQELEIANISKREKVGSINRVGENIEFSASSGTSEYKIAITTDSTYYITVNTTSIDIDSVIAKFQEVGLNINAGTIYNLKIVAIGDDNNLILPSVSEQEFAFKIIDTPTASIKLNEIGEKVIELPCTVAGVESFELVFTDTNNATFNINLTVGSESVLTYPLSNVYGLGDGEITVKIKAINSTQNYFDSEKITLNYTVLATPQLDIVDGVLVWAVDDNALNYTLYYNNNNWQTKTLTISDYELIDGNAYYVMKDFVSGLCQIKIKAVSKLVVDGQYMFDSQDSDVFNVLKLTTPTVSVISGEINVSLKSDEFDYIEKLIVKNLQANEEIDFSTLVEELTVDNTIAPDKLLKYIGTSNIANEKFAFQILAKNKGEQADKYLLNSEVLTCEFAGLKTVENIHIETSVNYDEDGETIDKIVWTNNSKNAGITKGYVIEINYYKIETEEPVNYSYTIEGENVCVHTFPNVEGFGAGTYKIKIKTLASNSSLYVNSKFSEEYIFNLASTPTNIKTENGKVLWDDVAGAGQYLVRVLDKNDNYLSCLKVKESTFDFNALSGEYAPDLYKITVQAINENDPNIVSSAVSTAFLVVKLPAINQYKLDMGCLYAYLHSFVGSVRLTLTSENKVYSFVGKTESSLAELTGSDWQDIADLDSILTSENEEDTHKFVYRPFTMNFTAAQLTQIIDCLNDGYTLTMQAVGNSAKTFATVDSNITNSASGNLLLNANDTNESGEIQRKVIKTKMPTVNILSRGVVSWQLVDTDYTKMNYNGLTDILLYNVTVSVKGKEYSFLVADNVDINNLPQGVTFVKFEELDTHTYYGYLRFDNGTTKTEDDLFINVIRYIDGIQYGELNLDFTKENIHYVEQSANVLGNAKVSTINIISGGNFDVSVNVVGDSTIYLTSNIAKSKTIIRYQQLTLDVIDGYLTWKNLKTDIDSPVYLVRVTDTSTQNTKYVYLYEENMGNNFTMPVFVDGATFKQAISFDNEYITFMLDTLFEGNYLFDNAVFDIDLTTFYRDNTSLATLQSKASPTYKVNKLQQIELKLNQGNLYWQQTVVGSSSTAIYDYEITAKAQGEGIVFRVGQTDYRLNGNMIFYNLPMDVTCANGEIYSFQEGVDYVFTVKALAMNNSSYINSNDASPIDTTISVGITNLAINDNIVSWDYAENGTFRIELTYEADGSIIRFIKDTNDKTFELPATIVDTTGQGRTLSSSYVYNIRVMRVGNNNVISSFYSTSLEVEKLKKLQEDDVKSVEGVLEWNSITNLAGEDIADTKYELIFVGDTYKDGQLVINEFVEGNTFDFASYSAGEIKFYIVIHHADYFKSESSNVFTYYKLGQITDFNPIKDDNNVLNTLTWKSVNVAGNYADAYMLEVYSNEDSDTPKYSATIVPEDKTADTINFNLASLGIDITDMRVRIRAISQLDNGKLINGEWSDFYSLSKANEVDSDSFKMNDLNVEWKQIDGEQLNDSYILQYFYKTSTTTIAVEERVEISIANPDNYRIETADDETSYKVYFYKLYKVGIYTNIRITVNRSGSMSSNPVTMCTEQEDGSMVEVEYVLNLFASGEGTEAKPYIINTVEQFKNIAKYPSSYYNLGQDINLQGINGNLVLDFAGVLNGNNHTLKNWTTTSTNEYLGIFEKTNGATIKNLNLSYINANMNSKYQDKAMFGSILVGRAIKTRFENITIDHAKLNISIADFQNSYSGNNSNFYFGGLAGYMENCTASMCNISLLGTNNTTNAETASIIAISGQTRDKVYFGGVAGYAVNTDILGSESKNAEVALLYSAKVAIGDGCTTLPNVYIGGVVGYLNNNSTSQGIKYISVSMQQNVYNENGNAHNAEILYQAGVCGYIVGGTIQNVTVSGNIGANEFATQFNSINIGKLVANYNKDVIKYILDNNVENMTLTYKEDGKVNVVEIS